VVICLIQKDLSTNRGQDGIDLGQIMAPAWSTSRIGYEHRHLDNYFARLRNGQSAGGHRSSIERLDGMGVLDIRATDRIRPDCL
jgi:hypothetical protein